MKKKSKPLTEDPRIVAIEVGGLILHEAFDALCHIAAAHLKDYLSPTGKEVNLEEMTSDALQMALGKFFGEIEKIPNAKKK